MYQMSLINMVRSLEKRIEVEQHQKSQTHTWDDHPKQKVFSTGVKPVAESENTMFHTSLITSVQIWERRWQAEEEQRKQRVRIAETSQETFLKRLPRLKFGLAKESNQTAEFQSCCQATSDYQDALHS